MNFFNSSEPARDHKPDQEKETVMTTEHYEFERPDVKAIRNFKFFRLDETETKKGPNLHISDLSPLESQSVPPSALSLNHSIIPDQYERRQDTPDPIHTPEISLSDYLYDQTLSPQGFDNSRENFNIHKTIASLFEDNSSVVSQESTDDTKTTLSLETCDSFSLNNASYLTNINFVQNHLQYLSQNVLGNRTSNSLPPSSSSQIDFDASNLTPDSIPGYILNKKLGSVHQLTDLVYNAIKIPQNEEYNCCTKASASQNPTNLNSKVIVRLSPNIFQNLSLSRFLNEWYILSGKHSSKEHQIWSNESLTNEYVQDKTIPTFDKESARFRPTLPINIPGILYPQEIINFCVNSHDYPLEHPSQSTDQKRFAMVYQDNDYKTFKELSMFTLHELQTRQGSYSSNESRRKSSSGFNIGVNATTTEAGSLESFSNLMQNHHLGATSTNGDPFHSKLAKFEYGVSKSPMKLIEILTDIMRVVETISVIHELGFVHNGLTSSNLLKSEKNVRDIKITGWGFAFSFTENCSQGYRNKHLAQVQDLIPYMAPEVLAITNSVVDYRSDFYSLGVIMYELVLGILPFKNSNPQKLIRMHTFENPIAPSALAPGWISEKLSGVIMKLLEKHPHNRYTDCHSLLHDLIEVKNMYISKLLDSGETVPNSNLNLSDRQYYLTKENLLHPEKMGITPVLGLKESFIGRRDFLQNVTEVYNNTKNGVDLLFISGESGRGKTIILQDLRAAAVLKQDFYYSWKFSFFGADTHVYRFLVEGVQKIITQILNSSEEIQNTWRDVILTHIPIDLSILFYLIPELKVLLGKKYTSIYKHKIGMGMLKRSFKEDQTLRLEIKLRQILKEFFKLVAKQGLSIFLDDVQWCSEESWRLLCDVLDFDSSGEVRESYNIKIVVCYALNADHLENVNIEHKKISFCRYAKQSHLNLREFSIPHIPLEDAIEFLCEPYTRLHDHECNSKKSDVIANLNCTNEYPQNTCKVIPSIIQELYQSSEGNVLLLIFLTRMTKLSGKVPFQRFSVKNSYLYDHLLNSNYGTTRKEILTNYLNMGTNSDTRALLKVAALISNGSGFFFSDLIVATDLPMAEAFQLLQICIHSRIIVPTSTYYKIPMDLIASDQTPFDLTDDNIWKLATLCSYKFYHDSICTHIIKELNASGEFKELSRLCGLRFYNTITKERLLNIGGYLQMATHFRNSYEVAGPEENEKYVEVLVQAGRYAISTYNMKLSQWFFNVVGELVYNLDSKTQLKSVLTIAENHFNSREFEQCLSVVENAQRKFGFDRLIFSIQIVRCKIELGDYDEAHRIAIECLKELGVPLDDDDEYTSENLLETCLGKIPLSVADIRGILKIKRCKNSRTLLMYQLISELIVLFKLQGKDKVRRFLTAYAMSQIHTQGSSPYCAVILIDFAQSFVNETTTSGMLKAKELSIVMLSLINRAPEISLSYVQSIYEYYFSCHAVFFESIEKMLDLIHPGNASSHCTRLSYYSSFHLIVNVSKIFFSCMNGESFKMFSTFKCKSYLTGDPQMPEMDNFLYDSEMLLAGHSELNEFMRKYQSFNQTSVGKFCYYLIVLLVMSREHRFDEAADLVLKVLEDLLEKLPVSFLHHQYYLICGKVFAYHQTKTPESEEQVERILARQFERYELWALTNKPTLLPRYLLLSTYKQIRENHVDKLEILDSFEEALQTAHKFHNVYDMCWINLECARWLISINQKRHRISRMVKQGLKILRSLELNNHLRLAEFEFDEYTEDEDHRNKWAGLTNNPTLDTVTTWQQQNMPDKVSPCNDKQLVHGKQFGKKEFDSHLLRLHFDGQYTGLDLNSAIRECLAISEALDENSILTKLMASAIKYSGATYGVIVTKKNQETPFLRTIGSQHNIHTLNNMPISDDICPAQLIRHVLHTGETVNKAHDHIGFANKFENEYFQTTDKKYSVVCLPLKSLLGLFGALYLEGSDGDFGHEDLFNERKCDLLQLFCTQAAVALGKERLLLQMELAKMAAEDATDEKASFLANMSHEIRTPFNSLLSFAIFLLDTKLDSTQREYVEAIQSSAMITLNIIDGILAFSKIEHGSFTLENAPFSLNDCIETAIQVSGETILNDQIELVFCNNCPEIEFVVGDLTRFRQIVINLVGNAIKFTTKGHVLISCDSRKITDDRFEINVSVEDSGIGISKKSQNKVFGAFSQVDGSARREYGGSGLGLAISKKLTELMGGTIRFESEEGIGTTFYVSVIMDAKEYSSPPFSLNKKCLIYSQHCLTAKSISNMLNYFGSTVKVTNQKSEFSTSVQANDIIFVDRGMEHDVSCKTKIIPIDPKPFKRNKLISILKEQPSLPTKVFGNNKSNLSKQYPLRILLAEDNLLNYKVCLKHLDKLGYKADHAKDGVVVLDKCKELLEKDEKYDVILMDIQMPRKDGITATRDLKTLFHTQKKESWLPVIVALTANVAGDDKKRCLEEGMFDFITKPILPDELRRILTKVGETVNM